MVMAAHLSRVASGHERWGAIWSHLPTLTLLLTLFGGLRLALYVIDVGPVGGGRWWLSLGPELLFGVLGVRVGPLKALLVVGVFLLIWGGVVSFLVYELATIPMSWQDTAAFEREEHNYRLLAVSGAMRVADLSLPPRDAHLSHFGHVTISDRARMLALHFQYQRALRAKKWSSLQSPAPDAHPLFPSSN